MSSFARIRARVASIANAFLLRLLAVQLRMVGGLDEPWYRDLRPDVPASADAVLHYLAHWVGARPPDVATARRLRRKEAEGAFNAGWYGDRAMAEAKRFRSANSSSEDRSTYDLRLTKLRARFGLGRLTPLQAIAPLSEIREVMCSVGPQSEWAKSAGITLATSSIRGHSLESCAASVARAAAVANVEWLIVNDEPGLTDEVLLGALPPRAAACARIVEPLSQQNGALPMAFAHGRFDWLVPLRADETITQDAAAIVSHYAAKFPTCGCFIGPAVEIDKVGFAMFHNPVDHDGTSLFEADPAALIVAVRRDSWGRIAPLPALAAGQEGYDCALRIAADEPVLMIPDYLGTRPAFAPPPANPDAARRVLLRRLAPHAPPSPRAAPQRGICFTRTQGTRLDLLEEAVRSVMNQDDMQSCIIVHADEAAKDAVAAMVSKSNLDALILHAPPKAGSKRGAPLNVGLDYLRANAAQYDVICFLDDDDVFYPMHAARLREVLRLSGADIAAGLACADAQGHDLAIEHAAMPNFSLASGNLYPINAFIVRADFVLSAGARFREDLHYLEDWDFLLQLYGAGARIQHFPEALCRYRVIGDGNRTAKEDESEFQRCWDEVAPRGLMAVQRRGRSELWRDLLSFDFAERGPLPEKASVHMRKSIELLLSATGKA